MSTDNELRQQHDPLGQITAKLIGGAAMRSKRERRERIASEQLAALIVAGWESKDRPEHMAVYYADALIAELDKGKAR